MLYVGGFIPVTFSDYPKTIASVLFTGGCNFKCPYCHNPHLVHKTSPEVPIEQIVPTLIDRIDGVGLEGAVISGGEPLINNDLHELIRGLKEELKLKVKLDTNGSHPRRLKHLLKHKLLDYIAMDIKGPFENYKKYAGVKVKPELLRESIKLIIESGVDHEFRQTIATPFLTVDDTIESLKEIKGAKRFYLQPFRRESELYSPSFAENNVPIDQETMAEWLAEIQEHTEVECFSRGFSQLTSKKVVINPYEPYEKVLFPETLEKDWP